MSIQDRHPTRRCCYIDNISHIESLEVLLMDLILHYEEILPPTLARKKRESDSRPLPIRKRTRPVDQRLRRSRLSEGGLDPQKLLEQQLEHKGGRSRNASPARASPPERDIKASAEAEVKETPSIPSPSLDAPNDPGNSTSLAAPPGDEDLPPRPMFVEPPPETNEHEGSSPASQPPPAPVPTTRQAESSTEKRATSRSPRPASPNAGNGATSLKRNVSNDNKGLRRGTRGPRPPSQVQAKTGSTANANDYAPRRKGAAVSAGTFSRRTQDSDAEDDLVGK